VPLAEVESALELEVELVGPPATSFAAPLVATEASERERHLLRAAAESDALLRLVDPGGARRAEVADAGALPDGFAAAKGPILALDPGAAPPRWELLFADGAELLSAQVDRLLYELAAGTSGRAFVRAWFVVRNGGLDRLAVAMPDGFELVEAERDGEPFLPGRDGAALVAPLVAAAAPQIVCLRGTVPLALAAETEKLALALPAASVPSGRVEVRLLAPGVPFRAAEPARRGPAGGPPRLAAPAAGVPAAAPLWAPAERRRAPSAFELPRPPVYCESTAAWSALAPRPAPLVLERKTRKEDSTWF
jgi:hypothetical protein